MEYKACVSEIKDIDQNGTVVFYPAVFNNKDFGGDTLMPGSTKKTLQENFKNIRHFKHHDSTLMPGVIFEASEDSYGVIAKSKLILGTQLGRETYEEYKAMAEVISVMLVSGMTMVEKALLSFINSDNEYAVWTIKNDEQVLKALEILNNKEEYSSILKGKTGSILITRKNDQAASRQNVQ